MNTTVKKRWKNGMEWHRSGRDISSGGEVGKCQERNAVNQEKQLERGWTCKWAGRQGGSGGGGGALDVERVN